MDIFLKAFVYIGISFSLISIIIYIAQLIGWKIFKTQLIIPWRRESGFNIWKDVYVNGIKKHLLKFIIMFLFYLLIMLMFIVPGLLILFSSPDDIFILNSAEDLEGWALLGASLIVPLSFLVGLYRVFKKERFNPKQL